jgi:hypothetical protein
MHSIQLHGKVFARRNYFTNYDRSVRIESVKNCVLKALVCKTNNRHILHTTQT